MNKQKLLSRLEQVLMPEFERVLDASILPDAVGYKVFNRYHIIPGKNKVTVDHMHFLETKKFTTQRTALSWCIADRYGQIKLADDIIFLETKKMRMQDDVSAQVDHVDRFTDFEQRELVRLKLHHKQSVLHQVNEQLNKCVNLAKYWQIKGFNNEIARTRNQPSN